MDPDQVLDELLDAATAGDPWGLVRAAGDLADWLWYAGAAPRDPRIPAAPTEGCHGP